MRNHIILIHHSRSALTIDSYHLWIVLLLLHLLQCSFCCSCFSILLLSDEYLNSIIRPLISYFPLNIHPETYRISLSQPPDLYTDTHTSKCWAGPLQRPRTHIGNGLEWYRPAGSYQTSLSCRWTLHLCCEWTPSIPDIPYNVWNLLHISWYEKSRRTLPGLGVKGESEKTLSSRFFIKKQI